MELFKFDNLVGETARLYLNNELNRFQLGKVVFEAIEDPSDGYRSCLSHVAIVNDEAPLIQFLEEVRILSLDGSQTGFQLVGETSRHVWLQFGTDNADDYYPSFMFRWSALPSDSDIRDKIKA